MLGVGQFCIFFSGGVLLVYNTSVYTTGFSNAMLGLLCLAAPATCPRAVGPERLRLQCAQTADGYASVLTLHC